MGGPVGLLLFLLVLAGLFVVIVWVLMWGGSWLHPALPLAVAVVAVGFLALTAIQTMIACAADPVHVPPAPGEGGEGRMIHACDGPGGMLSYAYATIAAPLAGLTIALSAVAVWCRRRRHV